MDSYIDVLCGLLMGIFSADSLVSGKDWCQVKLLLFCAYELLIPVTMYMCVYKIPVRDTYSYITIIY